MLVAQSCLTLCNYIDCSMPGLPVLLQLTELTKTLLQGVGDAIQPSHPLSSPSPPVHDQRSNPSPVPGESPRKPKAGNFLTLTFSSDHRAACPSVRPSPECLLLGLALSVSGDDSRQARNVMPGSRRQRDCPGPAGFRVPLTFCPAFASGLRETEHFPGVCWV